MIRRSFRIGLWLGLLAGIAFALVKRYQGRRERAGTSPVTWEPIQTLPPEPEPVPEPMPEPVPADPAPPPVPDPEPIVEAVAPAPEPPLGEPAAERPPKAARSNKKATKAAAPAPAWVDADAGRCPSSHPVKGKLSSKIFHVPGMLNYERTAADRCYVSAEAAEADGFRAAKR